MRNKFYRFCSMLMVPFLVTINCPLTVFATDNSVAIEIVHDAVEEATAGQRIELEVEVEDESGVEVVRAYFKAVKAENYDFVVLDSSGSDTYRGMLPAPANGVKEIDYLILVENGNNQVVKTQTFRIEVENDDNAAQAVANNDTIQVFTELKEAAKKITGFIDNIALDVVKSNAKLGVISGIYNPAATGGSSSGAVSAGTVAATGTGISTTAIVIGGIVAVAAVAGGVAIADSASSDDESAKELTSQTILGAWSISGSSSRGQSTTGSMTFGPNGQFTYNYSNGGSGTGSWTLSGTTLNMSYDRGAVYNGAVSGDSKQFVMKSNNGWTLNFSR